MTTNDDINVKAAREKLERAARTYKRMLGEATTLRQDSTKAQPNERSGMVRQADEKERMARAQLEGAAVQFAESAPDDPPLGYVRAIVDSLLPFVEWKKVYAVKALTRRGLTRLPFLTLHGVEVAFPFVPELFERVDGAGERTARQDWDDV